VEICYNTTEVQYKTLDEYKVNVNNVLEAMICNNECLIFAVIAERSGITRFVIRRYPQLRNYILERMVYYKEIKLIDEKINRAVSNLLKSNKKITFMSIINKCKFNSDYVYQNPLIKEKIRKALAENSQLLLQTPKSHHLKFKQ